MEDSSNYAINAFVGKKKENDLTESVNEWTWAWYYTCNFYSYFLEKRKFQHEILGKITLENDVITNECRCIVLIFPSTFLFNGNMCITYSLTLLNKKTEIVRNILEHFENGWCWSLFFKHVCERKSNKKNFSCFFRCYTYNILKIIHFIWWNLQCSLLMLAK